MRYLIAGLALLLLTGCSSSLNSYLVTSAIDLIVKIPSTSNRPKISKTGVQMVADAYDCQAEKGYCHECEEMMDKGLAQALRDTE
jgi:hypothetical protein